MAFYATDKTLISQNLVITSNHARRSTKEWNTTWWTQPHGASYQRWTFHSINIEVSVYISQFLSGQDSNRERIGTNALWDDSHCPAFTSTSKYSNNLKTRKRATRPATAPRPRLNHAPPFTANDLQLAPFTLPPVINNLCRQSLIYWTQR